MNSAKFDRWCESAVSGIRCRQDRKAVQAELRAHLEDRYFDGLDRGLTPEQAIHTAVDAMGSAEDIAPQLAAIHRPFWGYFLTATNWIIAGLACLCLISLTLSLFRMEFAANAHIPYDPYTETCYESDHSTRRRVLYVEPECEDTSDGYTFSVPRAAMWHGVYLNEDGQTQEDHYFYFEIRLTNPRPWAEFNRTPCDYFWAQDSLGNVYLSYAENSCSGEPSLTGNPNHTGLFTYTYDMWINNFCSVEAEWIDLHYDRNGRDITLRIDLTGGEDR